MPYRRSREKVALVTLSGSIARGGAGDCPSRCPSSEGAGRGESVVGALRVAEKNRRVQAVLFYVDSPGGDALASD